MPSSAVACQPALGRYISQQHFRLRLAIAWFSVLGWSVGWFRVVGRVGPGRLGRLGWVVGWVWLPAWFAVRLARLGVLWLCRAGLGWAVWSDNRLAGWLVG